MLERETVKVGEIARDVQLDELPLPIREVHRAGHPAIEQQGRLMYRDAVSDDGSIGRDLDDFRGKRADRLLFFRADAVACAKLLQVNVDHERIATFTTSFR